jgi:hypothetical protein
MTTVDVTDLDDENKKDLPEFIESKLMVKADVSQNLVSFEDKNQRTHVTSPEIRVYVKRFLHKKRIRKRFRLLSSEGTLRIIKIREDQLSEEEKKKDEEK